MAGLGEPQAFVQLDRRRIVGIDARDHDVLVHGRGPAHELNDQGPADALAAPVGTHMDAVLHAIAIARPRSKFAETTEAGNAGCVTRDDERKAAGQFRRKPSLAALLGQFDLLVHGGRVANHFVVDL
jgi:hypothetical protein